MIAFVDNHSDVRKPLLEVEASMIKMSFESRPRSHGLRYSVIVGGLFLTDKMTEGSILPVLVAPQQKVILLVYSSQYGQNIMICHKVSFVFALVACFCPYLLHPW